MRDEEAAIVRNGCFMSLRYLKMMEVLPVLESRRKTTLCWISRGLVIAGKRDGWEKINTGLRMEDMNTMRI
jgi:hypothetical protein